MGGKGGGVLLKGVCRIINYLALKIKIFTIFFLFFGCFFFVDFLSQEKESIVAYDSILATATNKKQQPLKRVKPL